MNWTNYLKDTNYQNSHKLMQGEVFLNGFMTTKEMKSIINNLPLEKKLPSQMIFMYARLVQHLKIKCCNPSHQQAKEEKSYHHISWCRKNTHIVVLKYNCYVFLINWPFYYYMVTFIVSCDSFSLKFYYIWHKCSQSCSLLVTIYMEYFFLSLQF